jgi:hypothetical protein
MSISDAQNSTSAATRNPLDSLLEIIRFETTRSAQTLAAAPPSHPSGDGDPLASVCQTISAEAAHQSQGAPGQWYPQGQADPAVPDTDGASTQAASAQGGFGAGPDGGAEARVGREVLAMLRDQPLDGQARAAAVSRLAAQIDNPEPHVLREVLAILVTGQST